jgi:leader peptidase (prepilin peptidase) / N-methyltransferase
MEPLFSIYAVCCGLILGSFFNVLIWRLPRHESIVTPPSHCPRCNRPIRPWENIPVASYILLRGKCKGCGRAISPVYPLIELATGAAALLLWHTAAASRSSNVPHDAHLALQCFVMLLMVPVTVIDLRHYIIPDAITYPLFGIALAASFLPGDTTPLQSIAGGLIGGGTLYGIGWLGKIIFRKGDAMGGGDIKLLAAVGALWGPKIALLTIFFGSLLATFAAVMLALLHRLNADHRIPFGPFLAAGLWTAVIAGDFLVTTYMNFVTGLFFSGH